MISKQEEENERMRKPTASLMPFKKNTDIVALIDRIDAARR